ncbi:MAG TPA: LamG-like jellyroll fold domain-containing protein, partial [Verrucomicrobiae bacterium]
MNPMFYLFRRSLPTSPVLVALLLGLVTSAPAAVLTHRYPFSANANDTVGGGNGQLVGGATISGGAVVLDGSSGYVNLPNNIEAGYNAVTIEAWVTDTGGYTWSRIFDFGNSSAGEDFALSTGSSGLQYMFLTGHSGSGALRAAFELPNVNEQGTEWSGTALPTNVRQHVVWTTDGSSQASLIYVNGVLVASNLSTTITPA